MRRTGGQAVAKVGEDRCPEPLALCDLRLAELSRMASWVIDPECFRIVWANTSALAIWQAASLTDLYERDLEHAMSVVARERLLRFGADLPRGAVIEEFLTLYPDGETRQMMCTLQGIVLDDGRSAIYCEAEDVGRTSKTLLQSVQALSYTSALVTIYDITGKCVFSNPAARSAFSTGQPYLHQRLVSRDLVKDLLSFVANRSQGRFTAAVKTIQGQRIHEIDVTLGAGRDSGEQTLVVTAIDVTAQETDRERMRFLARHDPMTGLLNRTALAALIDDMIRLDDSGSLRMRLFHVDLDRFKSVNDAMGHKAGDLLLMEVALRLTTRMSDICTVARLGGDEFLIFFCGEKDDERLTMRLGGLHADLRVPYHIQNKQFEVTVSMGSSVYPKDGRSFDELLTSADLASFAAKAEGGDQLRPYDASLGKVYENQLQLHTDLRAALKAGELSVWFQPRIRANGREIVGVEALMRWTKDGKKISPEIFIPVAERTGLINEIGQWILRSAAECQARLVTMGHAIDMSVNVSAKQFDDPGLISCLEGIAEHSTIDPSRFELEITETVLVSESVHLNWVLKRIRELGYPLAIDDFGTAYSNMSALSRYPIDCLKIDRSLLASDGSETLALGVISMARALGMKIVAEGVESDEQADWLARHGCDEFQGYHFGMPVPFEGLVALLDSLSGDRDGVPLLEGGT